MTSAPLIPEDAWRKSSHSGENGGDCLEIADGLPDSAWRKSSHSGQNGGDCLEIAGSLTGVIPVRDSKNPTPVLTIPTPAWRALIDHLKH